MRPTIVISLILMLPLLGCQVPQMTVGDTPLDGPFELRVFPERAEANPDELVSFTLEIENTGKSTIWIPLRNAVFPQLELVTHLGSYAESSWSSHCSGIEYIALKPGRTHRYSMGVKSPDSPGELRLSCSIDHSVYGVVKLGNPKA